jgi:lactate dehydrogenase-like 2-hydroxyacid dehydrogenase
LGSAIELTPERIVRADRPISKEISKLKIKNLRIEVLLLGPWLAEGLQEAITEPFVVHPLHSAQEPESLLQRCAGSVRALVCHSGGPPATRELLDRLPELELILCLTSGAESIDLEAAEARGIPVMTGIGLSAVDVAELAMALMLAVGRDLIEGDKHIRAGNWVKYKSPIVHRVSGKRLGILGMGAIGQQIAKRAASFDMEISYFSRRPVPDISWRHEPDLLRLARDSDFLISALPGGAETHHLIDASVLHALGKEGYLVNVGRGSVVDEAALVAALDDGEIAGAALDVFENEPIVPAGLLRSPHTVLQAHRGALTYEAHRAIVFETVERLKRHFLDVNGSREISSYPPPERRSGE